VDNPARGAEHRARDQWRHPAETLAFWGLKPRQTVIELSPGSGYWTEILALYAKATGGTYVATGADLANPNISEGAKKGRADFEAKYADAAKWGPVKVVNFGPQSGPLGAPGSADMVITARNIHNFMYQQGMLDKVMKDAFDVLKPGGVLAVEEHRADPRHQLAWRKRLGHIIVRARFQPAHPILFLTARGQHDDRHIGGAVGAAQAAAHLDPRQAFHHPVEQHDVGHIFLRHQQGFLAIDRMGDVEILTLEMPDQQFGQRCVILDQQHFCTGHGPYSSAAAPPRSRSGRVWPVAA